MSELKFIATLAVVAGTMFFAEARMLDMDNSDLDKAFRGDSVVTNREDLARELNSQDGPALVKKLLSDDRLKEPLYAQISRIIDESVRDQLLVDCLRDSSAWKVENDGARDPRQPLASVIGDAIYMRFPEMRNNRTQSLSLMYTFLTPQGRNAIATAYQRFLEARAIKPGGNEKAQSQLLDEIKGAMEKFGAKEFVYPPDPDLPPGAGQSGEFKDHPNNPFRKARPRTQSPPVEKEKVAIEPASPRKPWLLWAIGGALAMIAACLATLLRRFQSRR